MSSVKLIWATPDADKHIAYCARVSNPGNQNNPNVAGLLKYCAKNAHWSVFEMASVCLEINTTRDIARQLLRHRSFSFQEFSQRYADATQLGEFAIRECRMQDHKDRQKSLETNDFDLTVWWTAAQARLSGEAEYLYSEALKRGIAKEQARALLPEGLTPSKLYVNGTLRSWIHFIELRSGNGTQKEHQLIALACAKAIAAIFPMSESLVQNV